MKYTLVLPNLLPCSSITSTGVPLRNLELNFFGTFIVIFEG
ncbi:hypothetical protein RintRC_5255 [Richelia intracellularis]|nr:hypothetical protein RintRC_5255 [Richelia intracellularis]